MDNQLYSLSALNNLVSSVLKNAFPQKIWLEAEISRVYEKSGHFYLELVEKEGNNVLAKSSAVIWRNISYVIRQKLRGRFNELIQVGINVKVLVDISFHPLYGYKLIIHDLDPDYTMGKMEMKRRETLAKIKKAGLLKKNSTIPLPLVFQRIAVISSASAAGYKDFMNQLTQNLYGYHFHTELFQASMQGIHLKPEVIKQLHKVQEQGSWDLICLVRGGGSRVDLAWFDDYDLALEIAECSVPVITGIGHEIDTSVADIVAHTGVKTPTAAAEFIVQHNARFETDILDLGARINQYAERLLDQQDRRLHNMEQELYHFSEAILERSRTELRICESEIKNALSSYLEKQSQGLENIAVFLEAASPESVLKRGYAIVKQDDRILSDAEQYSEEKPIHLQFYKSELLLKSEIWKN